MDPWIPLHQQDQPRQLPPCIPHPVDPGCSFCTLDRYAIICADTVASNMYLHQLYQSGAHQPSGVLYTDLYPMCYPVHHLSACWIHRTTRTLYPVHLQVC